MSVCCILFWPSFATFLLVFSVYLWILAKKYPLGKIDSLNDNAAHHGVCLMLATKVLKISSGCMMPQLTIATAYDHNSILNYSLIWELPYLYLPTAATISALLITLHPVLEGGKQSQNCTAPACLPQCVSGAAKRPWAIVENPQGSLEVSVTPAQQLGCQRPANCNSTAQSCRAPGSQSQPSPVPSTVTLRTLRFEASATLCSAIPPAAFVRQVQPIQGLLPEAKCGLSKSGAAFSGDFRRTCWKRERNIRQS